MAALLEQQSPPPSPVDTPLSPAQRIKANQEYRRNSVSSDPDVSVTAQSFTTGKTNDSQTHPRSLEAYVK